MYIKKSRLVICAVALVVITAVLTIGIINPFGFKHPYDFFKFSVGARAIESSYYMAVDSEEAANMAIAGVAASTGDPYTNYMWGDAARNYMEQVEGNYCGVGMYIECDSNNLISVISSIPGSPAEKAGITSGDKILKVDGQIFEGSQITEATACMRGEEGTAVEITVRIAATGEEKEITLTRSRIELESVSSEMLDGGIGYISITQFTENVSVKFAEHINQLDESGMRALIVDLRNNPGGLLDEAVNTASLFIPTGDTVTYTLDKHGKKSVYKSVITGADNKKLSLPTVILVNGGSASASEVLTGALSDYDIATVIGERSYGKGIVQSVFNIAPDSLLSVTVSKYYTPNGVCIHGEGIEPDLKVEMDAEKTAKLSVLKHSEDTQLLAAIDYLK